MNPMIRMHNDFWAISLDTTVDEAFQWMHSVGINEVLVSDGQVLKGILTSSHIEAHRKAPGPANGHTLVKNIMTTWVPCCTGTESEEELLSLLELSPLDLLLVVDSNRNVMGVIRTTPQEIRWRVDSDSLHDGQEDRSESRQQGTECPKCRHYSRI